MKNRILMLLMGANLIVILNTAVNLMITKFVHNREHTMLFLK